MTENRKAELYNNLLDYVTEIVSKNDITHVLNSLGFTDAEIKEEGF